MLIHKIRRPSNAPNHSDHLKSFSFFAYSQKSDTERPSTFRANDPPLITAAPKAQGVRMSSSCRKVSVASLLELVNISGISKKSEKKSTDADCESIQCEEERQKQPMRRFRQAKTLKKKENPVSLNLSVESFPKAYHTHKNLASLSFLQRSHKKVNRHLVNSSRQSLLLDQAIRFKQNKIKLRSARNEMKLDPWEVREVDDDLMF